MKGIPILISIDVEPDERAIDPNVPKDWDGFEKTCEFFRKLRPQLEDATQSPVNFSWFFRMDPQIAHTYGTASWSVRRYRELIEEMIAAGDDLGLHVHAWRWDEPSSQWIADMGDQAWVEHCVNMGVAAFQESLNQPCRSFRFGNRWMNDATLELLEKLGVRFELTVEPGQKLFFTTYPVTGTVPDFTSAPRRPYRPSKADFRERSAWRKRNLWIIPMSSGHIDWEFTSMNGDRAIKEARSHEPSSRARESAPSFLTKQSPVYEGHFDRLDCQMIWGWAYDASRPNDALEVEVYDGETPLVTIPADCFRPDLEEAGKGEGRHAFCIHVPGRLKDGKQHSIRIKIAGSDFELSGSPKRMNCNQADWDEEYVLLLNTNPWVMRRAVDKLLAGLDVPHLALPVRTDVGSNSIELSNMEQNFKNLLSHPLVKRFVFTNPAELVKRVG
jgi:hypothetical protein